MLRASGGMRLPVHSAWSESFQNDLGNRRELLFMYVHLVAEDLEDEALCSIDIGVSIEV